MQDSLQNPAKTGKNGKKLKSLSTKVSRAVAIGCVLLGMLIQLIGITLYGLILVREYEQMASNTAKQVAVAVRHSTQYDAMTEQVLSIYSAHTKAEREAMDPEAYHALYDGITKTGPYGQMAGMLDNFCGITDFHSVSIAMPDPQNEALVVVVEAGEGAALQKAGDTKDVSPKFLEAFKSWNKEDELLQYRLIRKIGPACTVAVPILSKQGVLAAYLFVDVAMSVMAGDLNRFALPITLSNILVTVLITRFLVRMMKRDVVGPINAIAGAAQTYVSDKRSGSKKNSHFADLGIHTGDEVENLSLTMSDMEKDLQEIETALTKTTAENERISTELDMARRIQAESLPNIFPPFPDRTEFDIYALMHPAKEVGGDFYDFFLLDAEHLGLVIADVSGKGVPAALFMMISKMMVQNYALIGGSPREVLEKVNNQLSQNNREKMFVTVWLGILDLKTGHLTACNAGHEYPVLKRPGGHFEVIEDRHGPFIGIKSGLHYRNYELQLEKGAKLFVYTDGVPEAMDANDKMFDMDRMVSALREAEEETPERILGHVRKRLDGFVGDAPQFDDITMLCLQFNGPKKPIRECELPAVLDSIPQAVEFARREMAALSCPGRVQSILSVAIDEVMSNIVHFAYGMGIGSVRLRIEETEDPRGIMLTFIDSGVAFNPLEAPEPDVTLSPEKQKNSGMGIFLVRKMADDMSYERVDGRNILRVRKQF